MLNQIYFDLTFNLNFQKPEIGFFFFFCRLKRFALRFLRIYTENTWRGFDVAVCSPQLQSIFIPKQKKTIHSWETNISRLQLSLSRQVFLSSLLFRHHTGTKQALGPPTTVQPRTTVISFFCLTLSSSQPGQSSKTNHRQAPSALCCSPEEATDERGRFGRRSFPHLVADQRLVSVVPALLRTG